MKTRHTTTALACLLLLGCGDGGERNWDIELVVQLFKPKTLTVGTVTIQATQAGVTRTVKVNTGGDESFFADCTSNRVRIIPRAAGGPQDSVKLSITTEKGGLGVVTSAVALPNAGLDATKKIVLGVATTYAPAGECSKGLGSALRELGTSCVNNTDCKSGLCLKTVKEASSSTNYTFENGYCSKDCYDTCDGSTCRTGGGACSTNDQCRDAACKDNGGTCFAIRNASLVVVKAYCLRPCKSDVNQCKRDADKIKYQCTPGDVCLPKP